ncbi:MAG: SH3 domain-containing protein [Elusimicrobia bacterium]|nr:SH3 domain-containing protein [Elusimicrobiota bacterium]
MKKLYILLLIVASIFIFKEFADFNINYSPKEIKTGINYNTVDILEKNTNVLSPSEIKYEETKDKIAYESDIPRRMKTSGYWISKIKDPDKIVLSKKAIADFNFKNSQVAKGITDLEKYPQVISKEILQKTFNDTLEWYKNRNYFKENGEIISPNFYITLVSKINLNKNKLIKIRYAITTHYNDVRIFPTKEKVLSGSASKDIDRLQEESIDMGTPILVLCQTKDKVWSYVVTKTEEGWIETKNLAFTNRNYFVNWLKAKDFVVVTEEKADIFKDKKVLDFVDYVRMGSKFPYYPEEKYKNSYVIKIPTRDKNGFLKFSKAFINKKDVHIGYMDYTQRYVLKLAFKYLNEPYGWGGSGGEQDCSGYLSQIFNCFGITLPETSTQKIKCGKVISFQKTDTNELKTASIIKKGVAGISFIYLPGHIMLYLGKENGVPYIIHAIWGVTSYDSQNNRTVNYINKVIVSDLNIGEEVAGNSLIDRVSKFNIIK